MVTLVKYPYKFILQDTDQFTKVYAPERYSRFYSGFLLKRGRRMKQGLYVTAITKSLVKNDYVATFTNSLKTYSERNLLILRYLRKSIKTIKYPMTLYGRLKKEKIFFRVLNMLFFTHRLMPFRNLNLKLSKSYFTFNKYDSSRSLNKQMMFNIWLNIKRFTFDKPFIIHPRRRKFWKKFLFIFSGFKLIYQKYRLLNKKRSVFKIFKNTILRRRYGKYKKNKKNRRNYTRYKYPKYYKYHQYSRHHKYNRYYRYRKFKQHFRYNPYLKFKFKRRESMLRQLIRPVVIRHQAISLRKQYLWWGLWVSRLRSLRIYGRRNFFAIRNVWYDSNPYIPNFILKHRRRFLVHRWYHCKKHNLEFITVKRRLRLYRKTRNLLGVLRVIKPNKKGQKPRKLHKWWFYKTPKNVQEPDDLPFLPRRKPIIVKNVRRILIKRFYESPQKYKRQSYFYYHKILKILRQRVRDWFKRYLRNYKIIHKIKHKRFKFTFRKNSIKNYIKNVDPRKYYAYMRYNHYKKIRKYLKYADFK